MRAEIANGPILTHQRYGSPRVLKDLRESGEHVGRNRVIRLMRLDGLRARTRKRFKCTTMSDHQQPVADNMLARNFEADAPTQRWVVYNQRRRHSTLDYVSPARYERERETRLQTAAESTCPREWIKPKQAVDGTALPFGSAAGRGSPAVDEFQVVAPTRIWPPRPPSIDGPTPVPGAQPAASVVDGIP